MAMVIHTYVSCQNALALLYPRRYRTLGLKDIILELILGHISKKVGSIGPIFGVVKFLDLHAIFFINHAKQMYTVNHFFR